MKTRSLILIGLFLAGISLPGWIQAAPTAPSPSPSPSPRPETPSAHLLIADALSAFKNTDYVLAQKKLEEAENIKPDDPFIANLIGAIQTKKKEYAEAKRNFEKSLDLQPGFFPARFNLGELLFLQKEYPQALESFTKMLNRSPGNELLQFKVILCLLKTNQPDDAKNLLKRMKMPIDSPAKYYAEAAIKISENKTRAASDLVRTARTLFPKKVELYDETFSDLGWLQ